MIQGFQGGLSGIASGGGGGGGGGGTWFNLSEYIGDQNLLAGAPTRDTTPQWVSGTSDATGTTMNLTGAAAGSSTLGSVSFNMGLVADVLPGWPTDASGFLVIRGTMVTDAPVNSTYWQGIYFHNEGSPITTGYTAGIFFYTLGSGTRDSGLVQTSTYYIDVANTNPSLWNVQRAQAGGVNLTGSTLSLSTAGAASAPTTTLYMGITASRVNAGAAVGAKVLWEIRGAGWE